jgi:hypothetical protein
MYTCNSMIMTYGYEICISDFKLKFETLLADVNNTSITSLS